MVCRRHALATEIKYKIGIEKINEYLEPTKKRICHAIHYLLINEINKPRLLSCQLANRED